MADGPLPAFAEDHVADEIRGAAARTTGPIGDPGNTASDSSSSSDAPYHQVPQLSGRK